MSLASHLHSHFLSALNCIREVHSQVKVDEEYYKSPHEITPPPPTLLEKMKHCYSETEQGKELQTF